MHHHTKTCRKYSSVHCRFHFPRCPSLKTMISIPVRILASSPEEQKKLIQEKDDILNKVQKILQDDEMMQEIESIHHKEIEHYKLILKKMQTLEIILGENAKKKEK